MASRMQIFPAARPSLSLISPPAPGPRRRTHRPVAILCHTDLGLPQPGRPLGHTWQILHSSRHEPTLYLQMTAINPTCRKTQLHLSCLRAYFLYTQINIATSYTFLHTSFFTLASIMLYIAQLLFYHHLWLLSDSNSDNWHSLTFLQMLGLENLLPKSFGISPSSLLSKHRLLSEIQYR